MVTIPVTVVHSGHIFYESWKSIEIVSSDEKDLKKILTEIAMQDGRLSLDETMIIGNAMRYNKEYKQTLEQALEDNVIDLEERSQLDLLRKRIFEGSADVAEKDDIITEDETKLLMKLLEYIIDLRQEYDE